MGNTPAMRCPSCAHENREGRRFCVECGARLELICPSCGVPYEVGEKFCGECGTALAGQAPPGASPQRQPPSHQGEIPPPDGERRQLTVLFCDLVGSTALSTRLDPEELRELVRAYQAACAEVVERYGGHIAQYLGDGLLVYFGYPQAHEDDAQRAVRAGLGMVQAMAQLNTRLEAERGLRLAVRVGIHIGLVVVGEMGGGARREHLALGEVPNVAARLQALAEPGTVVISGQTERLVHGYFDTRELGPQPLKGIDEAVGVHQVLRPNRSRSRVDVAAERGLSPFAGRAGELETLLDRFERARAGQTQLVFVHGEPGIGKSRLLYELKRRLEGEDLTWLEGRCISYGQSIPYLPLIDLLKANFRIEEADTEETIAAKLERGVRGMSAEVVAGLPYLKHLLALDPGDVSVAAQDPQMRKAYTFEALRALAVAGAAVRPLVLVVEDIHWIDPLSEEWLSYLAETVPDRRLLLVITYRPDYEFRLGERPNFTHLQLQSLSAEDSEIIACGMLDADALPQELQELIVHKAEGNPLFVEEVTKSLAEAGAIERAGSGYVLARPVEAIEVPDTVQDVIMARLDRLAS